MSSSTWMKEGVPYGEGRARYLCCSGAVSSQTEHLQLLLSLACCSYPRLSWMQFLKTVLGGGESYRKLCGGRGASQCSPAVGEPLGSGESLLAWGLSQMERQASICMPASLGGRRGLDARRYPRSCPTCAHSNWPSSRKRLRSGSIPVGEGTSLKPPSLGLHEKILGLNEEIQSLPDLILTNNN